MAREIYKKFESLSAFHSYVDKGQTQPNFVGHEDSKRETSYDSDFYGTKTYQEAEDLLLNGDEQNASKIEKGGVARERKMLKLDANRRKLFCDVTGVMPHVPNYIAGVPTTMVNARMIRQKQKVLNLVYNVSVNGSVGAKDMEDVAIKMLTAIMRCEANGVRINLYVCDISEKSGQIIGWLLRIKSSGQHLDVLKAAYPLTNPAMLRRHSFRFTEILPGVRRSFVDSYGAANRCADGLLKACGVRNARTLSYYTMRSKDVNGIVEMILGGK